MDVLVETDLSTGASYFVLSDEPVAATVHISDLVMVDVDADGAPVAVDVAAPVARVSWETWLRLYERFPTLKDTFEKILH